MARGGILDGVQYSTSPASDLAGSPAAESDEATSNSAKSEAKPGRMQANPHIEVKWIVHLYFNGQTNATFHFLK